MALEDYPSKKRMEAIRRLARALGKTLEEEDLPRNELEARQIQWDLLQQIRAKGKTEKMIDKSKIRGELVRLKTDLEETASDIKKEAWNSWQRAQADQIPVNEELFRGTVETTMQHMEICDLRNALEYLMIVDTSHRFLSEYDHQHRIPKIESLLIDTLVEIANNNCKCRFKEE